MENVTEEFKILVRIGFRNIISWNANKNFERIKEPKDALSLRIFSIKFHEIQIFQNALDFSKNKSKGVYEFLELKFIALR